MVHTSVVTYVCIGEQVQLIELIMGYVGWEGWGGTLKSWRLSNQMPTDCCILSIVVMDELNWSCY